MRSAINSSSRTPAISIARPSIAADHGRARGYGRGGRPESTLSRRPATNQSTESSCRGRRRCRPTALPTGWSRPANSTRSAIITRAISRLQIRRCDRAPALPDTSTGSSFALRRLPHLVLPRLRHPFDNRQGQVPPCPERGDRGRRGCIQPPWPPVRGPHCRTRSAKTLWPQPQASAARVRALPLSLRSRAGRQNPDLDTYMYVCYLLWPRRLSS